MKVRVLLFAGLKELLGRESLELDSPEIFTVGDVCKILKTRYPGFGSFSRSLLVAVNQEFADFQSRPVDTLMVQKVLRLQNLAREIQD